MDDNNKKTEDIKDAKGLKEEGIDILSTPVTTEEDTDAPSSETQTKLPPVFPEDANLGGFIKDGFSASENIQQKDGKNTSLGVPNKPGQSVYNPIIEKKFANISQTASDIPPYTPLQKGPIEKPQGQTDVAKNDPSIKPLRTYKTDTEEAIQSKNISVAKMVVAETEKKKDVLIEHEEDKKNTPWISIIISILLVAVGATGLYYVYLTKTATITPVSQDEIIPSILRSDKQIELPIDGSEEPITDYANKAKKYSGTISSIIYYYPTTKISGEKIQLTSKQFFAKANVKMPDRLMRSLGDHFMLGLFIFEKNTPFIILKNTFYQNTYSGMLEWEKNMYGDLISIVDSGVLGVSLQSKFEDYIVRNKDVRTLKTVNGATVLTYVFINQSTVLITTNQKGLEQLIDKMTATRVVQ